MGINYNKGIQTQQEIKTSINKDEQNIKDNQNRSVLEINQNAQIDSTPKQELKKKVESGKSEKIDGQNRPADETNQNENQQFQWKGQKKILLLGTMGVGKKTLFRQLSNQREEIQDFQEYEFSKGNQNYCITKSVDFDFDDDDIDLRENQIVEFQNYINKNPQIYSFLILVNFERTNIMKKKVVSVYKFVAKFKDRIFLGVTSFQLSQDSERDQEHLKDKFNHMINKDRILFFRKDDKKDEIQKKITKKLTEVYQKEQQEEQISKNIDLANTIFEKFK